MPLLWVGDKQSACCVYEGAFRLLILPIVWITSHFLLYCNAQKFCFLLFLVGVVEQKSMCQGVHDLHA